jgi:cyclopropane-fatty-acyl-phospholipid synthase
LGILNWIGSMLQNLRHLARSNTLTGSKKNIEEHYDLGNDMYSLFLDDTMTYSSGLFRVGRLSEGTMEEASLRKYDALISKAGIKKGDLVAEIGCGWGGFAIRAAKTIGCKVIGITLSKEQLAFAVDRVRKEGLQDLITLKLVDYRDFAMDGQFDHVVSCEMIEAVGHEHLDSYFSKCASLLKPGGNMVIQAITINDDNYENYCNTTDFIRRYIFPGGHLPSLKVLADKTSENGLTPYESHDMGKDYAETLRRWRKVFIEKKGDIMRLGYSEQFYRKFNYYFAYCEAGFDAGYISVGQLAWKKTSDRRAVGKSLISNLKSNVRIIQATSINTLQLMFVKVFAVVMALLNIVSGLVAQYRSSAAVSQEKRA